MEPALLPPPLGTLVEAARIAGITAEARRHSRPRQTAPSRRRVGGDDGTWSDIPECDEQYENDSAICRRRKSSSCWQAAATRLDNCRRGKLDHPPLLGW
jgi:hypothetical protein